MQEICAQQVHTVFGQVFCQGAKTTQHKWERAWKQEQEQVWEPEQVLKNNGRHSSGVAIAKLMIKWGAKLHLNSSSPKLSYLNAYITSFVEDLMPLQSAADFKK